MQVQGRHTSMPSWRAHGVRKKGDLVGVELEVFHAEGNSVAADSLDKVDFGKYPRPIAEIDGSLCRVRGVELVLPPLPTQEVISDNGYLAKMITALKGAGVTNGERPSGTGYGLHLNFNVADWTPNERAVVQYALNAMNRVGRNVARRDSGFGNWAPRFNLLRAGHTVTKAGGRSRIALSTWPGNKYAAAWIRPTPGGNVEADGTVLEFRAPRSTLLLGDVQLAVSYVAAVRQWVSAFGGDALAACYLHSTLPASSWLDSEFMSYWHHVAAESMKGPVRALYKDTFNGVIPELERTPYEGMLTHADALRSSHFPVHNKEIALGGIIYGSDSFKEQALYIAECFSGFRQIFAAESQDESRSYRPPTAAAICAAS